MIAQVLRKILQFIAVGLFAALLWQNILVVPHGTIAFLKDRTAGWQKETLPAGTHWLWTGFVPEKWKVFFLRKKNPPITVSVKLPLKYTKLLKMGDDFFVNIAVEAEYSISPEKFPVLLELVSYDVGATRKIIRERIRNLIELKFFELYRNDAQIPALSALLKQYVGGSEKSLLIEDYKANFPEQDIILQKIRIAKIYVPDAGIYAARTGDLYPVLLAQRQALLSQIQADALAYEKDKLNTKDLEKAAKMSGLIHNNPKILEYYKIEKLNPKAEVWITDESTSHVSPKPTQRAIPQKKRLRIIETPGGSIAPLTR